MTRWATVTVVVETDDVDVVSGLLWSAGVAGVEESSTDAGVELRAGCTADVVDAVCAALGDRWVPEIVGVEADAGLDAWREHAEAWRAGERFVIVPPWIDPPDLPPDGIVLSIDPGHAFGSGSHATTRLCLEAIERSVVPGLVVADIGSGSGVLAIAAAHLGAARVIATDIDPNARSAAMDNARSAGVDDRIEVLDATPARLGTGLADVVVANIGAATLRTMATDLTALLTDDGLLVLSGILVEQLDDVVATYAAGGLDVVRRDEEIGWCVVELRRTRR